MTDVINFVLQQFCEVSGQAESKQKSLIFFSRSVQTREARILSAMLGIPLGDEIGRHLGVPILHKKVNKYTYQALTNIVFKQLNSWNAKSLLMGGRITLIQSVLLTISLYTMQTSSIKCTLLQIEGMCCDFVRL